MRLYIKQKVFSFGDKYNIFDESGNAKYIVQGEVFSFGKKLHVYDLNGQEFIYIEQKVFSFLPKYYVYIRGQLAVTIVKKFTIFSSQFIVEGTDLQVEGDFFAHDFRLVNAQGQILMAINKKYMTWGDSYEMEIGDPAMEALCIGVNLCIDAAIHDQKN